MDFNNTTNKSGLIQDCEFWLFASNYGTISGNTNMLATFTNLINRALDSVTVKIMESDDRWQFDDTNYTDYPIATTDLILGQRDYVLSVNHVKITRVECKDQDGNWNLLKPMDLRDTSQARDEFLKGDGIPLYYDKMAQSLFLYPQSNYNSTGGLRVYYQREPDYFVSTDTTKSPGFPSVLNRIVSIRASLDYAIANNLTDKITVLTGELAKRELEIEKFYGRRNNDEVPVMREKMPYGWYGQASY